MTLSAFDRQHVEDILGGNGTWFSAQLIRLIAKAHPDNRAKLRLAFPDHVAAYENWCNNEYRPDDGNPVKHLEEAATDLLEVAKRTRWLLAQERYPGRERDEATILKEAEVAIAKATGTAVPS